MNGNRGRLQEARTEIIVFERGAKETRQQTCTILRLTTQQHTGTRESELLLDRLTTELTQQICILST